MATIAGLLFAQPAVSQTYTSCNPLQNSNCPADPALATSIGCDFTGGACDQFNAQGAPTYDSNGASFSISQQGDSPTLVSPWYIMFGKVEITMKSAPGTGIVSSVVLQSDDLDEIDWEWVGSATEQVQSNYYGKGQTTTYDRAALHDATDCQNTWHKYTVDWTAEEIVWQIDGTTVRALKASDADGQYPQTPMQIKFGVWAGGDPSNPSGTIAWAGGVTDYSAGPYTMVVDSVSVTDYSTGSKYTYGDQSGDWSSIESTGGRVNGNIGADTIVSGDAPAVTTTSGSNVEPYSGTHASCSTCSSPGVGSWTMSTSAAPAVTNTDYPGLPSGWTVSGSGKVVPPSAAPSTFRSVLSASLPAASQAASCSASGYSIVTSFDQEGFLTTATMTFGVSTGWDEKGFPTTVYPANCMASTPSFDAEDALKTTDFQLAAVTQQAVATSSHGEIFLQTTDVGTLASTVAEKENSGSSVSGGKSIFLLTAILAAFSVVFSIA